MRSAVDGSDVDLRAVFAAHEHTLLLYDGAAPTSAVYKTLVGLALAVAERFGQRVAAYIVTSRNDRPFEIPCEVGILFDLEHAPPATDRAAIVDPQGELAFVLAPVDATVILARLTTDSGRPARLRRWARGPLRHLPDGVQMRVRVASSVRAQLTSHSRAVIKWFNQLEVVE